MVHSIVFGFLFSIVWFSIGAFISRRFAFGNLIVDDSSPDTTKYSIEITKPLDDIPKKKTIVLKVVNGTRN